MPDFEVLDARIASALNRIIHNFHFKRRVSLEEPKAQKQDRFLLLPSNTDSLPDLRIFRVTGANDSVENDDDLITIGFRNDGLQDFELK